MFNVRCRSVDKHEDACSGVGESESFDFDVVVSSGADDGWSDNGDDNDDNDDNEDGNIGNDVAFVVIDVDADFKGTDGTEAVNVNCNDKGNSEGVGEEGFGAAAGLIGAVADDDDDDDDVNKKNDKCVVCNDVNVDNDVVLIRNGYWNVVDDNDDKGNGSNTTVDFNFDCLDGLDHSRNSDVDARDSDVIDECDVGCTRDCCVNNKAFVSENVTGEDKVDGVGSATDNNSRLEFDGNIERDNWGVAGIGSTAVCVSIDENDDEDEDSNDKDCKANEKENDTGEEERALVVMVEEEEEVEVDDDVDVNNNVIPCIWDDEDDFKFSPDPDASSKDVAPTWLLLPLLADEWCRISVWYHTGLVSEELDRLVTREPTVTPIVILFCPVEISPEAESNANELFDKCGKYKGVLTGSCCVSACRGPDVSFEENKEDLSGLKAEFVDFKDALFCVTSVATGTGLSDVNCVNRTWRAEVLNSNLDLMYTDFSLLVTRYVEVIVLDIFVDVRLLSCSVPSTGEYAITCVFDVESFVTKYPVTLLSLTADVCVDKW